MQKVICLQAVHNKDQLIHSYRETCNLEIKKIQVGGGGGVYLICVEGLVTSFMNLKGFT